MLSSLVLVVVKCMVWLPSVSVMKKHAVCWCSTEVAALIRTPIQPVFTFTIFMVDSPDEKMKGKSSRSNSGNR